MAEASAGENWTAALLGAVLVGGVYADGWAHLNIGGLDSFFTPWHGVLYGGFTLLTAWLGLKVWRRHDTGHGWLDRVPSGYGWGRDRRRPVRHGWAAGCGLAQCLRVEVGLDALLSPTHLLLPASC